MFQSNYAQTNKKARLSIDCSQEERKQIKMAALMAGKTISQWVLDSALEKLASIPAETTHAPPEKIKQIADGLALDVQDNLQRLSKR